MASYERAVHQQHVGHVYTTTRSKITEDEAKDFDTILSKAKVAFSYQNSWYISGF